MALVLSALVVGARGVGSCRGKCHVVGTRQEEGGNVASPREGAGDACEEVVAGGKTEKEPGDENERLGEPKPRAAAALRVGQEEEIKEELSNDRKAIDSPLEEGGSNPQRDEQPQRKKRLFAVAALLAVGEYNETIKPFPLPSLEAQASIGAGGRGGGGYHQRFPNKANFIKTPSVVAETQLVDNTYTATTPDVDVGSDTETSVVTRADDDDDDNDEDHAVPSFDEVEEKNEKENEESEKGTNEAKKTACLDELVEGERDVATSLAAQWTTGNSFNLECAYTEQAEQSQDLLVELWMLHSAQDCEFLGELVLPLSSVPRYAAFSEWLPLRSRAGSPASVTGQVLVFVSFSVMTLISLKDRLKLLEHKFVYAPLPSPKDNVSIPRERFEAMTPLERKQQEVVVELINTEKSYVRDLNLLVWLFMNGMLVRRVIDEEEASSLFSNIPAILCSHVQLLELTQNTKDLERLYDMEGPIVREGVAAIFLARLSSFKLYSAYFCSHADAQQKIETFRQRPEFHAFLEECFLLPECRYLGLDSFLSAPLQRMVKYPLLLAELQKCTKKEEAEYQQLGNAAAAMRKALESINARQRQEERARRMLDIQASIENHKEFDVTDSTSRFVVKEGEARLLVASRIPSLVSVFLFNDLFFVAKKKGKGHVRGKSVESVLEGICALEFDQIVVPGTALDPSSSSSSSSSSSTSSILSEQDEKGKDKDKDKDKEKEKENREGGQDAELDESCVLTVVNSQSGSVEKGTLRLLFRSRCDRDSWARIIVDTVVLSLPSRPPTANAAGEEEEEQVEVNLHSSLAPRHYQFLRFPRVRRSRTERRELDAVLDGGDDMGSPSALPTQVSAEFSMEFKRPKEYEDGDMSRAKKRNSLMLPFVRQPVEDRDKEKESEKDNEKDSKAVKEKERGKEKEKEKDKNKEKKDKSKEKKDKKTKAKEKERKKLARKTLPRMPRERTGSASASAATATTNHLLGIGTLIVSGGLTNRLRSPRKEREKEKEKDKEKDKEKEECHKDKEQEKEKEKGNERERLKSTKGEKRHSLRWKGTESSSGDQLAQLQLSREETIVATSPLMVPRIDVTLASTLHAEPEAAKDPIEVVVTPSPTTTPAAAEMERSQSGDTIDMTKCATSLSLETMTGDLASSEINTTEPTSATSTSDKPTITDESLAPPAEAAKDIRDELAVIEVIASDNASVTACSDSPSPDRVTPKTLADSLTGDGETSTSVQVLRTLLHEEREQRAMLIAVLQSLVEGQRELVTQVKELRGEVTSLKSKLRSGSHSS